MDIKSRKFNWLGFVLTLVIVGTATALGVLYGPNMYSFSNGNYGDFLFTFEMTYALIMTVCFVLGVCLAVPNRLGFGREFLCRLPLEVLAVWALIDIATVASEMTQTAQFYAVGGNSVLGIQDLPFFGGMPIDLDAITMAVVVGGWLFNVCMFFCAPVALIAGLRVYGFWGYCKRSLTGRIIIWIIHLVKRLFVNISNVNLSDPIDGTVAKVVMVNFVGTGLCCMGWIFGVMGLIVYSVVVFVVLRRFLARMQKEYVAVLDATNRLAAGELSAKVDENELNFFAPLGDAINHVGGGFAEAVREQVKSQGMKTELITNVSHDLKTPLTAIITYVDLLKNPNLSEGERADYVATLNKKSQRLKVLIEDLFEMSKAASGNAVMHFAELDICALLRQVQAELADRIENSGLEFRFEVPNESVILVLDGQKTYRIFENLIVNMIKYSLAGTRAYVTVSADAEHAFVVFKNISASELNFSASDITERFVRGDESRTQEGSGLGLAIVKSFAELQNAAFQIKTDGDLFKATLTFSRLEAVAENVEGEDAGFF